MIVRTHVQWGTHVIHGYVSLFLLYCLELPSYSIHHNFQEWLILPRKCELWIACHYSCNMYLPPIIWSISSLDNDHFLRARKEAEFGRILITSWINVIRWPVLGLWIGLRMTFYMRMCLAWIFSDIVWYMIVKLKQKEKEKLEYLYILPVCVFHLEISFCCVYICLLESSLSWTFLSRALHNLFGFGMIVKGDASPHSSVDLLANPTSLANIVVYTCVIACLKNLGRHDKYMKKSAASWAMEWVHRYQLLT